MNRMEREFPAVLPAEKKNQMKINKKNKTPTRFAFGSPQLIPVRRSPLGSTKCVVNFFFAAVFPFIFLLSRP